VTLFEFGRTIWCTCGSRVGVEPRIRTLDPLAAKRFIADAMLGRLARWLRLLGFDCVHASDIRDDELVRRALQEERVILSRDRKLPEEWWVDGIYLVRAEDVRDQLAEVIRHFDLATSIRLLSRCNACNRLLEHAAPSDLPGRVPPRILRTHENFSQCPGCGRVYWEGSHTAKIRSLVDGLIAEDC
jgi:uncharacterized protein with PIN domain